MLKVCKGIFGFFFGHNFQARYTSEDILETEDSVHRIRLNYQYDICKRCGNIV